MAKEIRPATLCEIGIYLELNLNDVEHYEQSSGQNVQKAVFKALYMWRDKIKSSKSVTLLMMVNTFKSNQIKSNNLLALCRASTGI